MFRTYKGNIENGIQGSMQLRNPDNKAIKSDPWTFTAKDDSINTFDWPRKLDDADQKPIDLLKDLVTKDGRLEVVVSASIGPSTTASPSPIATSACPTARRCGISSRPRSASGCRWCS